MICLLVSRRSLMAGCILLPLLAGCATGAPVPASLPGAYFASGTEPGWTLEIAGERLTYHGRYGEVRIIDGVRSTTPVADGRRIMGARMDVTITHVACNDGMSERRYPDTVIVIADGERVTGCGGLARPGTP